MRLLIVGQLGGQISAATRIAMNFGAKVAHVDTIEQATAALRAGRGADLLMVDARLDIAAVLAAVCNDDRQLVAADPAMKAVIALADQIAPSDASIMITGESGVGKEVLARYVHKKSNRADKAFIAVNCAAIPEQLLESELFGHEKGSFTGAVARRIGKFEEADGGTLLLDEISEMDLRLQSKLLRALQERVIDRVGGSKPVPVNIRVLATSNRDLTSMVRAGEFREDLLYRLNVVNLRIPPLRERKDDLAALAQFFIDKYAHANGRPARRLSKEGQAQVFAHNWPGNVRELENAMHRAVLLSKSEDVGADAIRAPDGAPVGGRGDVGAAIEAGQAAARALVGRTVADVEQDLILETLTHCLGNRTHAAHILGISIRTLRNKLKQYSDDGLRIMPPPTGQAA
ncbi:MAG: sigma-54-dependent Fis family transcriptional regulator [Alphaproteobacteria bacterium]|nr:MAG: sigma-54-dependent Fis family transcriptional regulator [Alphaproteobacteria bacterium]